MTATQCEACEYARWNGNTTDGCDRLGDGPLGTAVGGLMRIAAETQRCPMFAALVYEPGSYRAQDLPRQTLSDMLRDADKLGALLPSARPTGQENEHGKHQ